MYIAKNGQKITVGFHNLTFKPFLKKVTASFIFRIIPVYIAGTYALYYIGNRFFSLFYQQMYMVIHQAITVKYKFTDILVFLQCIKKSYPVLIVLEYGLAVDTPKHNMVYTCSTSFPSNPCQSTPPMQTRQNKPVGLSALLISIF